MRPVKCPKCQNADSLRTQLAWQSQVSHTETPGRFLAGVAVTEDGLAPGLGYQQKSRSTHQTDLAKSLEPPVKPPKHRIDNRLWAAVASYFVVSVFGALISLPLGALALLTSRTLAISIGALGVFWGFKVAWRHFRNPPKDWSIQQSAYEQAMHRWQNEWFCPSCGYRWQSSTDDGTTIT